MGRAFRISAIALLAVPVTLFARGVSTATLFVARVNLGSVTPARAIAPPQSRTIVQVTSDRPWQLAASLESAAGSTEKIELSTDATTWIPLVPALPLPVGSGDVTPPDGIPVSLYVRVKPTFNAPPGRRQSAIALLLNGQKIETPLRLAYEIPPTVSIEEDQTAFAITADQPNERRDWDFSPHVYVVHSNTDWVLEIAPHATQADAAYSISVLDDGGSYRKLEQSMTIATGGPTGDSGTNVRVQLRLHLNDTAPAGKYATMIDVRARLAAAASQQ